MIHAMRNIGAKKIFKRFTNLVVQFFIFLAYKVFITFDGSMSL